jgi:hypothetical protein
MAVGVVRENFWSDALAFLQSDRIAGLILSQPAWEQPLTRPAVGYRSSRVMRVPSSVMPAMSPRLEST